MLEAEPRLADALKMCVHKSVANSWFCVVHFEVERICKHRDLEISDHTKLQMH